MGDDAHTVLVNAYGESPGMSGKMRSFLHYIRTGTVTEDADSFVKRIHEAVVSARAHEEWRVEYMTLLMWDAENVEKGRQKGRREGIKEGITLGTAQALVNSVDSAMKALSVSLDRACEVVGTTVKAYTEAKELISKG